ncbi:MAG: hypothetical protein Q8Q25_00190 [bacterium]|nr:hypothetical protein [bacterium]
MIVFFKIIYFFIFLFLVALRGQRQLFCVHKTVGSKGHQQPAGLLVARIPATRLTARTIRRATGINFIKKLPSAHVISSLTELILKDTGKLIVDLSRQAKGHIDKRRGINKGNFPYLPLY